MPVTTDAHLAEQPPPSRTQAQRSAATRDKVLDATIEALIDVGYTRTTTQEVNRRAGVSRGALLHQFPTRESLVVAAVSHLVDRRLIELLDRPRTGTESLSILLEVFDGPLFYAALELWVAARTDSALRAALISVERKVAEALTLGSAELFGDRYTPTEIEMTIELARGLAVSRILRDPDADRALSARLLNTWMETLGR